MNEQTTKLIAELATKLGTTAEHLWAVLVRQAPLSCGIMLLAMIAQTAALAWFSAWLWKQPPSAPESDYEFFTPRMIRGGLWFAVGILWIIFGSAWENAGVYVSGFTNPEFWALKQILK